MRLVVFGSNGGTGHQVIDQALAAGHQVAAVTRRPERIPQRNGLTVIGADVADADAVDGAIAGGDAVLSALGVSYSRKPITVYSAGATNIIAAMHHRGVKRLIVVSSSGIDPDYHPSDGFLFNRVIEPFFMRRPGRTLYEDMRRMEALVQASDLDWTIIRPCWLFDTPEVTDYEVTDNSGAGIFTARADLAASMLAQLSNDRFVRKAIGVTTTAVTPRMVRQIWYEATREKKR